ncbi:peptidase [Pikeienuella piscinae]|uniref:Parvulin-like PPIase n=2 Tax=Pikeienuella piscinae TaxID=2748098 RepID=A0A7M3T786_9RHOB|nr:peptidase [Pikeienuella piscinae]
MQARALQPEVSVNGEVIPSSLIAAEAQNHPAPPGKPGLAWRAAARALAVRALLLQAARRLELDPEQQELGPGRRETRDEALVRAVIETHVRAEPPDDDACRAFYAAHEQRFRAPNLYEAAHILLPAPPDDPAARAKAREFAEALLKEIMVDARAFDRLARENSACESRGNGGRLGQITAGDTVPEFEAALEALEEGAISPAPVETRYGFHIIRLDARAEGEILPFDNVRQRIREMLERAAWARGARALVTRLLEESTIEGVSFSAADAAPPDL